MKSLSCEGMEKKRPTSNPLPQGSDGQAVQRSMLKHLAEQGFQMYGCDVSGKFPAVIFCIVVLAGIAMGTEAPGYFLFVSNERSGDVTVIDGASDVVVTTFPVGKRPRGIHAAPDGKRIFVALSGSPRMAPGVDTERAPADKTADGLGVIDVSARKLIDRWHVGSDPEQFAISKDGKLAFIANEDDASIVIVDLSSGQTRGKVKVSAEPEGVAVNPANGEVYATCEEKGEVFAIAPDQQRVIAQIDVGGRPRSIVFSRDGNRGFATSESGGFVAVIDPASHKLVSKIQLPQGSLPMGCVISKDGKELYVSTGRGNAVVVIDAVKNEVVATIPVGNRDWGIALSPDGSKLYTANGASDDISVVDVKARKELKRIKVGSGPWGIAIVGAAK
jgi:YVTN family beta-propeller protein